MEELIEKTISQFVENQFPSYYREEGPVFVQFVTEYYKWLESTSPTLTEFFCEKKFLVDVVSGSNRIVGYNTMFNEEYVSGDSIAICQGVNSNTYDVFTIDRIESNTVLFLSTDKLPTFTLSKTRHGTVVDKGNPLYYARRFTDIKDIDKTFEEFLVSFKEKYLKGIQFKTATDTRRLVKHSLDLYRSKGTERSLELLFRIAFGVGAKAYYPAKDLFKLSAGQWFKPKYLEVSLNDGLEPLVNKQIYGLTSGAKAFVQSVVRKVMNGKLVDVLYISADSGTFMTGELINTSSNLLDPKDCPTIVGSLNEVYFITTGSGNNFSVGDIVDLTSEYGKGGKGRVTSVTTTSGLVTFVLTDGGYGYTNTSQVLVSENIVTISNATANSTNMFNSFFEVFDQIIQPAANISFNTANGTFLTGSNVFTYHANNSLNGSGRILSINYSNSSVGEMRVSVLSGNMNSNVFNTSNVIASNTTAYFDMTRVANVIGFTETTTIDFGSLIGDFINDEEIYQIFSGIETANGIITSYSTSVGLVGTIRISDTYGIFRRGTRILGRSSGASANVNIVRAQAGVIDVSKPETVSVTINTAVNTTTLFVLSAGNTNNLAVNSIIYSSTNSSVVNTFIRARVANVVNTTSFTTNSDIIVANGSANLVIHVPNTFLTDTNNYVYGEQSLSNGTITVVSTGEGATVNISTTLTNTEFIDINTDFIRDYLNVNINAVSWGFPGNTSANLQSTQPIDEILSFSNVQIGRISSLIGINQGNNYNQSPLIKIYEEQIYPYEIKDEYILTIANPSGSFQNDEVVIQSAVDGRGIVVSTINATAIRVKNIKFYSNNLFIVSNNTPNTVISGTLSGSTANIVTVSLDDKSDYFGFNGVVDSAAIVASGAITSVDVTDSGFGFINNEEVTVTGNNNQATGFANLYTKGIGSGQYRERGGYLSDVKKLHDGDYWQEYSYEVRASVTLNNYSDMLKEIIHVSGTKFFGLFILDSSKQTNTAITSVLDSGLYDGFFPIHDYEQEQINYLNLNLFPMEDYNIPIDYLYDCNNPSTSSFININNIELNNTGSINIIYDCELYNESADLNDTLRRN